MPMEPGRNAGFSAANPHRLYLPLVADAENHPKAVNVEAQPEQPDLAPVVDAPSDRRRPASRSSLSRGDIEFLYPENRKVVTFLRTFGVDWTLVVANLSRSAQFVELDLSRFDGEAQVPVELSARPLQVDRPAPYFITLAPYGYFWFRLQPDEREEEIVVACSDSLPGRVVGRGARRPGIGPRADPPPLPRRQRWFGAKGQTGVHRDDGGLDPVRPRGTGAG